MKKLIAITIMITVILSMAAVKAMETGLAYHWTFDTDGTNSVEGADDLIMPETNVTFDTVDGKKGITLAEGALIYKHQFAYNPGSSFTMSLFMKSTAEAGYQILLAKDKKDQQDHFEIYLESGYLCLWAPSIGDFKTGILVADDTMHHIAITYNGSKIIFYVDGINSKSFDLTGAIPDGVAEAICVGILVEQQFQYKGFLDDLRLYTRPLNENEIKVVAGIPTTEPAPQTGVSLMPLMLLSVTGSTSMVLLKKKKGIK